MTWRDEAACRDHPDADATFFPLGEQGRTSRPPDYRPALRICSVCPVRSDCLAEALALERGIGSRHGVWGGTTPEMRARKRKTSGNR